MGLDIRLPVGLLFSILGLLLAGFGAFSRSAIYDRSLGLNVNIDWGVVLLIFGIVMVLLGNRGRAMHRRDKGTASTPIQTAKGSDNG
jgi:hypothetical protein